MSDNNKKMTWDLESIFPGGSASAEYNEFRKAIAIDLDKAQRTLAGLPRHVNDDEMRSKWTAFFLLVQNLMERIDHASGFVGCLIAQDVADEKAMTLEEEISSFGASWETIMTGVEEFAVGIDDAVWNDFLSHPRLATVAFFWNELRQNARLRMAPEMEKLATELAVHGYHAWNRLYTKLAGDLQVEFTENGKAEVLSLGQLNSRFNSPDRDIRRQAFEKLEESWKKVEPLAAIALNSQAGYRLCLYKRRGWESPLLEPLLMGRLKQETVDAMWRAVAHGGRKMADYIKARCRILGIDKFRWYDQTAPVAGAERKYSYDEAADFIIGHLSSFMPEMGGFARMAIDRRWIEAEDRPGKAAGGFCTGLDLKKESRIFMTFAGNYGEMMTLAHEIGHAYHSWVLRDQDYFARQYPLNLAETASTFNELLVTDAAFDAATDPMERLYLLDNKLQDGFIMFCNIHARYIFDRMFYEERKKGAVPAERLNALMVDAQKTAFGDILADDGYHSLFWASKLHFFETEMPFYNFPYTFGYLFAGGVYDRAKEEGATFAEKYKSLLADTGSMTTEEIASKHLGLDITTDVFWNSAVGRVLGDIEPYAALVKELV